MNTTRPRHFPVYRLYKMRKGISNDKDLALQAMVDPIVKTIF